MAPEKRARKVCRNKVGYRSEAFARCAGQSAIRLNGNTEALWTYACPLCSKWHLTKRVQFGTPAITEQKALAHTIACVGP